ncbi:hypothetical protein [Pseudorhodoferax sp.]|uniref:hypothetical protein n=1 Tax=Pseudorhodoferax sp. TaxID=1993553 RepID=UPI0039E365CD
MKVEKFHLKSITYETPKIIHWQLISRKLLISKDSSPGPLAHQGLPEEDFDGMAGGTNELFPLGLHYTETGSLRRYRR